MTKPVLSERYCHTLPSVGQLQGESSHVPHPPQEGGYTYDEDDGGDCNNGSMWSIWKVASLFFDNLFKSFVFGFISMFY